LTDPSKYYVIDVRDSKPYAEGHIPNSVNIALRGRFETWTGMMVPWDSRTVVTGSNGEMREALYRLHRVGYQAQCVGFDAWKAAGLPTTRNEMLTPRQLYDQMQTAESPIVVDVRQPKEWEAQRIGKVLNMPLTALDDQWVKLDRSQRVVAVCNSAYRSSLAVGILERNGFQHASSMAGGGDAWVEAGLPVVESTLMGASANLTQRYVRLAERIDAAELKRLLMDLPGTFQLVDIRPPGHFADFRLPGSQNVAIADVLDDAAILSGSSPLIIVDRDGSLAMMVAGILSQKTQRPFKALFGGLQSYWDQLGPSSIGGKATTAASPAATSSPASNRTAPPVLTKKKKRRSAGC
jgi:rhodanese-related sulfurtransferase